MISLNLVKDTSLTFPTVLNVPIPAKNINKCNCSKKTINHWCMYYLLTQCRLSKLAISIERH